MSLAVEHAAEAPVTLTWRSPEPKLWVATAGGEYAGIVEFVDGHFVARGRTGEVIGGFSSIPNAQQAVRACVSADALPAPLPIGVRASRGFRRGHGARQDAA